MGQEGRKITLGYVGKNMSTKDDGGLRVRDLKLFNIALLGKWKWRMGSKN